MSDSTLLSKTEIAEDHADGSVSPLTLKRFSDGGALLRQSDDLIYLSARQIRTLIQHLSGDLT